MFIVDCTVVCHFCASLRAKQGGDLLLRIERISLQKKYDQRTDALFECMLLILSMPSFQWVKMVKAIRLRGLGACSISITLVVLFSSQDYSHYSILSCECLPEPQKILDLQKLYLQSWSLCNLLSQLLLLLLTAVKVWLLVAQTNPGSSAAWSFPRTWKQKSSTARQGQRSSMWPGQFT